MLNQSQPQASYQHDFLGRRVVKSVPGTPPTTRHFQYDRAGHLLAESDGQGNAQAEYIWLDDIPVALVTGGALNFMHPDHLGTPQKATDTLQNVVWDAVARPFGQIEQLTGSITNNLRFPGQYFDAESSLHDNWFRTYDPSTGRYLQSDPIGLGGGVNTYAYVRGNPILLIDPLGLRALTACEKEMLSPYIPKIDLDNADLITDHVPDWLISQAIGVTVGNNIYFRPGEYDASTPYGLSQLGHELIHVGQFRNGMDGVDYGWEALWHGIGLANKYENPAYAMQNKIFRDLTNKYGDNCGCKNP